ncbi:MAG: hypothetical protein QGG64_10875 [Candidatus Latescibacteria bacterium]|jgi:hypothetical protein|nr:hypothetical protein [Candidatus Latescibacterota bacterium]|tara:strand:+ start:237 stop:413 length:177 start_codon:yes stop_codon:yes gene_type:complete
MKCAHYYLFAQKMLPAYIWQGDGVLGILANPENQDYLIGLWEKLSENDGFTNQVTAHQ